MANLADLRMDDRHEWRDEHIKLIQTNKRKLWYRMLEWCLFVHDFDPYAIFKGQEERHEHDSRLQTAGSARAKACALVQRELQQQTKNAPNYHFGHNGSLFRSKELQMQHTGRDRFRHSTTRILRLFSIYFLLKSFIIAIAQHTLMRYEYLVPKNQSRPLVSLEDTENIVLYLGNPFSALKDISLVLYVGPAGFCVMCVVLLPFYYRQHRAMNIAQLRFALDPRRELKRVDASIRFRLTATRNSLRIYHQKQRFQHERTRSLLFGPQQQQQQRARFSSSSADNKSDQELLLWLEGLGAQEDCYCQTIEKSLDELELELNAERVGSLRPCTFAPNYYVALVGQMEKTLLGSQAGYSLCWVVLSSSLVYSAYSNKCPTLDCQPERVFSWPELLVIIESLFILAVTNLSSTLNATLFNMLATSQLELIKSISAELRLCNEAMLSCLNSTSGQSSGCHHKQHQVKITLNYIDVTQEERWAGQTRNRDEVEKLLLKSLIKLTVGARELRDNSRCISEQTLHPFYYVGGALLLAATGAQFKSSVSDSNFLRWFMVFVIWFSFNQVAVVCANIYARLLECERHLLYTLAMCSQLFEVNYYQREVAACNHNSFSQPNRLNNTGEQEQRPTKRIVKGKSCSFVADLWLKFVHSTSANLEQHCSRLFNIELNYQTIIEANFFSIFMYSLTLSPNDTRA